MKESQFHQQTLVLKDGAVSKFERPMKRKIQDDYQNHFYRMPSKRLF